MTLEQNGVLRYGHLSDFLGTEMANLGLIDFKIGLYIKVNVNGGPNLKSISQNIWPKWPSIGKK